MADPGVNPRVCLCGGLQIASAQTLDLLDIGEPGPAAKRAKKRSSFPDEKPG